MFFIISYYFLLWLLAVHLFSLFWVIALDFVVCIFSLSQSATTLCRAWEPNDSVLSFPFVFYFCVCYELYNIIFAINSYILTRIKFIFKVFCIYTQYFLLFIPLYTYIIKSRILWGFFVFCFFPVWKTSFYISCSTGLLVMNSFCKSEQKPLFLKCIFSGYKILRWPILFFPFSTLLCCILACHVFEKLAVIPIFFTTLCKTLLLLIIYF